MILTIANISTRVAAAEFQAAVAAIQRQVTEHFAPEWSAPATLRGVAATINKGKAPIDGTYDALIYLGDESQDANTGVKNALGYHMATNADKPYGFVYLDVCAKYGELWTTTLSHEVLELLADPTAALTVTAPGPKAPHASVYYDLEVCDPTQGDSYAIDGVTVSNFVGRRYFGLTGGSGETNHLKLPLEPFGVRPAGYFQYEQGGKSHQLNGEKVTKERVDARKLMDGGRRNERRERRLPG